jgi:hypothetical protein
VIIALSGAVAAWLAASLPSTEGHDHG